MKLMHSLKIENWHLKITACILGIGFFLATSPVYAQDITSGLVGHWKFDETSGTTAADSSGNNNTGTLTNIANPPTATSGWTSSGKINSALSFDGVDDYVLIPNSPVFNVTSYTISAWIKTANAGSGRRRIFSQQVFGGDGDYYLMALNNNILELGDQPAGVLTTQGSALNNNVWRHIAVSKNAGVSFNWYVDGVSVGTQSTANTTTHNMTDAAYISRYTNNDTEDFSGLIDDVHVYNRALSASDIQTFYNYTGGPLPTPDTIPPSTPTNLTATIISSSQINFSWTASTDNVGVTGYRVERCQGSGCTTFIQVATPSTNSYNDTGLISNTTYTYRVRAVDAAGNLSGYSSIASAITQPAPTGGTVLGNLATSMAPGTWAELVTNGLTQSLFDDGGSGGILGYSDDAAWDPIRKEFLFLGAGAGFGGGSPRGKFISYQDSTNNWSTLTRPVPPMPNVSHAYDHLAIDTARGIFYSRYYGSRDVYKYNITAGIWSVLPANNLISYVQCCGALEYFPEYAGGGLVLLPGGDNGLYFFSDTIQTWTQIVAANSLPMGNYENFAEYNPVHKVIWFGGGHDSRIYRLNQNGQITQLRNAPINLGIYETVITADPVTGIYIVLSNDLQMRTYDVMTDTWSAPLGTPPPLQNPVANPPTFSIIATPVSTYGVNMFVKYRETDSSGTKVFLYKHASGSTPPSTLSPDTTAPTISLTAPSSGSGVSGSSVTVSATASDPVVTGQATSGLAGVQFKLDGTNLGAEVTTSPYVVTWNSTIVSNGSHTLAAVARDAAGNTTTSAGIPVTVNNQTQPPSTFTQKCSQQGVVHCFDFDTDANLFYNWPSPSVCDTALAGKARYTFGRDRQGPGNTVAVVQNGQCIFPQADATRTHSGAGSLKFTIPSNSYDDSSGYFSEVYKRNTGGTFAYIAPDSPLGNVVYMQWYQYLDANFLNTNYQCLGGVCGGWKQVIQFGNPPNGASSSGIEVTNNNGWQRGVPQMYGQAGTDGYGIQDVRGCFYNFNGQDTYPEPPCIRFKSGQWMEFTTRIEVRGTPGAASSRVQLWVDGQLAIDYPSARINWDNISNQGDGVGQYMLTPYHTNKDPSQVHPTAYTWYDDLIISTQPIAMTGTTPPPPTLLGDLNNDGAVNALDWSIMESRWFTADATADINKDGVVNSIDFSLMNQNWGRSI